MTDGVSLAENNSVQWLPPHEPNAATTYANEQWKQYDFVPDETKIAQWPTGKGSSRYLPKSISAEFFNAQEPTTWGTKASMPNDEPDPTTEFLLEIVRRQSLVLNEGTGTAQTQSSRALWPPFSIETLFEFLDELEYAASDIVTGFTSVNESAPPPIDVQISTQVEGELDILFSDACEEEFEVGMESQFSRGLQQLCTQNPNEVLLSLKARLENNKVNLEVFAEALGWVSRQEALTLRNEVINLFWIGLNNTSPLVRDAAALGLACFDENIAISYLKQAIEKEDVPELREDLEELVQSLEM